MKLKILILLLFLPLLSATTNITNNQILTTGDIFSQGYNLTNGYLYTINGTFRTLSNLTFLGGNVGIGTTSPSELLEVVGGDLKIGTTSEAAGRSIIFGRNLTVGSSIGGRVFTTDNGVATEKLRFTRDTISFPSTNSVGIGTTSPVNILQINGTTPRLYLTSQVTGSTGNDGSYLGLDGNGVFKLVQQENQPFTISTNGTEYFRITSSGLFGINTTNPVASLQLFAKNTVADGSNKTLQIYPLSDGTSISTILNTFVANGTGSNEASTLLLTAIDPDSGNNNRYGQIRISLRSNYSNTTGFENGGIDFYGSNHFVGANSQYLVLHSSTVPIAFYAGYGNQSSRTAQINGSNGQVFLTTAGRFGINDSSPASTLHVNSSFSSGSFRVTNLTNLHFFINGSNGFIGIGATNPSDILHLNNNFGNTNQTLQASANNDSTIKLLESGAGDVGAYLKYDGNNNRFGIWVGNNPPVEKFTILRDSTAVGIGITNPSSTLETKTNVNLTVSALDNTTNLGLHVFGNLVNTAENIQSGIRLGEGYSGLYSIDRGTGGTQGLGLFTGNVNGSTERVRIGETGLVGVNTTTPQNTLNVIGSVNATVGFIVNASTGFTGYCVNTTYVGGIATSCND